MDARLLLATATAATLAVVSVAAAAAPDVSFGEDGKVVTAFGSRSSTVTTLAVQPDGKVIAAGVAWGSPTDGDFALARYRPDGSLDPAFGAGGMVRTNFGGNEQALGALVSPGGRLVVAGEADGNLALARYRPDGTLDRSFGAGGRVVTDLGRRDFAVRVFAASGGGVVAVGGSAGAGGQIGEVVLVRYRADGRLDTGFGRKGIVRTAVRTWAFGAATGPRGTIVVSASRVVDPSIKTNPPLDTVLLRYRADGTLDRGFDGDGVVVRRARPHSTSLSALAVQRNGAVIVGGHGHPDGATDRPSFMLLRFRPDGSLDRSFGEGGVAVSSAGYGVRAVTVDASGRIVAAGASQDLRDFALARFTSRGEPDPTFGPVTADFGAYETPWAVVVQADGRIVAAGQSGRSLNIDTDFALAAYR